MNNRAKQYIYVLNQRAMLKNKEGQQSFIIPAAYKHQVQRDSIQKKLFKFYST